MGKTGKTGMMPAVNPAGGAEAPKRKKPNNLFLWGGVALLIIGAGVGLFFALREPPPRHISIQDMEREMMDLLDEHFSRLNSPFDEARHELYVWYYKPLEGTGPEAAPKYRVSDPIPLAEAQDRFVWDRNAVIIKGLPCTASHKVFDNEHRKMGDKLIDHPCKFENLVYFLNRPNIYKDTCIRCGKVYEIGTAPARPEITETEWDPDKANEQAKKNHDKYFTDIANKHGISPVDLQKRITHALEFRPVWPPDRSEIPEEKQMPDYYEGTVRYLKIRYFWDQSPRIHKIKEGEPNPVRFEKIWPAEYPEGEPMKMGTLHFRRGQLWLYEAKYQYKNGNLVWVSQETQPIAFVDAGQVSTEIHEYVETQEILDLKAQREKEEADKRAKAKKKTSEPKPEEKKPDPPK